MPRATTWLFTLSLVASACCSGQSRDSCATCMEAEEPEAGTNTEPCSADPDAATDASDAGTGGVSGSGGTGGAAGSAGSGGATPTDAGADQ